MNDVVDASDTLSGAVGELLIKRGKLSRSGLDRALRLTAETGERVDLLLTKLGQVSERDIAEALSAQLELPLAEPDNYPVAPLLPDRLSAKFLHEFRIIPLSDTPAGIAIAMADPLDGYAIEAIRLVVDKPVLPWVGIPADIEAALTRLYGVSGGAIGGINSAVDASPEVSDESTQRDIERLRDLASEAPVIRLVNLLISRAVDMRASDIHIEPFEHTFCVRYRIDGVLREQESPPSHLRPAIVSRIKLMAKLNIAETRLPQDGRIKLAIRGKEIDLRVSTVPTLYGESLVLRVLDRSGIVLNFEMLGFNPAILRDYIEVLDRSHGILLVTGPTGSGKTTTLYASLRHLNTGDRKILTVEDPIEYQLEGINQVQVKPQIGLTFANTLRSFLRQDPDVIMVGEIRDRETAQIAVQAALTGHIVLSTLHTNNASSTVTRLLDMGIEDYLLTSTVNGIVAQRLVRMLCANCREAYVAPSKLIDELQLYRYAPSDLGQSPHRFELYRAQGCSQCGGTGYHGRTSILEMLVMSDAIRQLVIQGADANGIQSAAIQTGMCSMYQDGISKALAGITSLEEVVRVTREA
jgi:general secretion pathway protein E